MKTLKLNIIAIVSLLSALNFTYAQQLSAEVAETRQEQNQWCWAANTACIVNYYGTNGNIKQCELANKYLSNTGNRCCQNGSSRSCNRPNGENEMKRALKEQGELDSKIYQKALSISQIKESLTGKRPFIMGWRQANAQVGHVVVGCGYNPEAQTLTQMDPWENRGMQTNKYTGGQLIVGGQRGNWAMSIEILTEYLGVDEQFKASINVYPTLANNTVTVTLAEVASATHTLSLYNCLGAKVASHTMASGAGKTALDVSALASGVYLLKVNTLSKEATFKIVKQ